MALHERWVRVFDWVGGAAFLASVALFWYTRRSQRSPRFLLDLALVYEVFITLNIGILNYAVRGITGRIVDTPSSFSSSRRSFPARQGRRC